MITISKRLYGIAIAAGFFLASGRILLVTIPGQSELLVNCFKDAAHIYMGAIGLVAWLDREMRFMFWAMCIVEIGCFALSRMA